MLQYKILLMLKWLKYLWWIIGPLFGLLFGWFIKKWSQEHPEYGEKIFYYLLRLIPFAFSWKKRKIIEKEIHAYITEEIKSVNSEAYGFKILPKGIKIEWVPKNKEEIVIEENEIVIRLGSRINPCENFVDALMLYLSNSFIPNERLYLDPALYEASKFQIAISMLRKRTVEFYSVFIDKYYKSALEKHKEILNYSEKLEIIEKSGLFTPVFLPTLSFYTEKWIFQRKSPSLEIQQEISELLDFFNNIASKKEYELTKGEEPPLTYQGKHLKIGIVLVARKELSKIFDYRPHLKVAKGKLKYNDILFVSGRGKNTILAEKVALKLKKESFFEQIGGASTFYFYPKPDTIIKGVCYAFKKKNFSI